MNVLKLQNGKSSVVEVRFADGHTEHEIAFLDGDLGLWIGDSLIRLPSGDARVLGEAIEREGDRVHRSMVERLCAAGKKVPAGDGRRGIDDLVPVSEESKP